MKTCPQCGFHHADSDERCVRCEAYLDEFHEPDPLTPMGREVFNFRINEAPRDGDSRWARWTGSLRRRLFIWQERLRSELPEDVHQRNPWLAGFLGLVPGLGQLYNHQRKKAALMLGAVGSLLLLALLTLHHPVSNWVLLCAAAGLFYSFHDAAMTAKAINREPIAWLHRATFMTAWVLYVMLFMIAFQFFATQFLVTFHYIAFNDMKPYIRAGERIVVDKLTYQFREPRVGDVVFFDPPSIKMEKPGNILDEMSVCIVNPRNMIERIVAGPGQTFERRAGEFYLDGQPAPPERQPIVQAGLQPNFKLTAGPDQYIVLFSYTGGELNPVTTTSSFMEKAPSFTDPAWVCSDWAQGNFVTRDKIFGRVWCVYQPPPARRWVK